MAFNIDPPSKIIVDIVVAMPNPPSYGHSSMIDRIANYKYITGEELLLLFPSHYNPLPIIV